MNSNQRAGDGRWKPDCTPRIAHRKPQRSDPGSRGFTLLEFLVAMAIMLTAFTLIWSTFSSTMKAWTRGTDLLDELHHGDYVLEQLTAALRSAAFFNNAPDLYRFHLETDSAGSYPGHLMSWVTSSPAFLNPDDPLANGLHRLTVTIEKNEAGDDAVAVRAFPHLADLEDDEPDPWFVSSEVKGLRCRVFNIEDEVWEEEWKDTNSIPSLVEVTLYMDPLEEFGRLLRLSRAIHIPIMPPVTNAIAPPRD